MKLAAAPLVGLVFACTAGAQERGERWYQMDYGPVLSTTVQGFDGENVAYKARALDLGGGAWVVYDTELMRVAAAWTDGYLALRGTPFDGAHGAIPEPRGTRVIETAQEPGWAKDGSFANPRAGRYGPLPRDHARYEGFYLHDRAGVIAYRVGAGTRVLEKFDRVQDGDLTGIARTLECTGVGDGGAQVLVAAADGDAQPLGDGALAVWRTTPAPGRVRCDRVADWGLMGVGEPSDVDYADVASGHGCVARWVDGRGTPAKNGAPAAALLDGRCAEEQDQPSRCVFSDDERARFTVDLQDAIDVQRVSTFSWHVSDRAPQSYRLWGSAAEAPRADGDDPKSDGWQEIARVDTTALGLGGQHGSTVSDESGKPLGRFRHLLWDVRSAPKGTFFTEVDVWSTGERVRDRPRKTASLFGLAAAPEGARLRVDGGRVVLDLPRAPRDQRAVVVACAAQGEVTAARFDALCRAAPAPQDLAALTHGGKPRWPDELTTRGSAGTGDGAYVVDTITVPQKNPWRAWLRFGAFDFTGEGSAALSTWNGDVWQVAGLDAELGSLRWRRIATGLHDPLGLKVVDGIIHVHGRDGITRLHDLNGDGEIDWFECLNDDVLVTRNFHEFAFDLQTDAHGDFYFAKAGPVRPGGRGFDEIVAHHGTIMKLAKDGSKLEVYATGLRAPNGIGVSPDGVVTSGDNEGTWMPACRLNWFPKPGMFASCVDTSHRDPKPAAYGDPLCWFPMDVDNSGGGQVWVTSDRFGPLQGELLHQSYGTCNLYLVLRQGLPDGRMQGGVAKLPLSFASSQMRARFSPSDGHLYVCGFKGWQTRAAQDTAFQRVRYTGKPLRMPRGLAVTRGGIDLEFGVPLSRALAEDPQSWTIQIWNYKWCQDYGSPEFLVSDPSKVVKAGEQNRDTLVVRGASLGADGRTVHLDVEGLRRCMQMRIAYDLECEDGAELTGDVYNTVNFVE